MPIIGVYGVSMITVFIASLIGFFWYSFTYFEDYTLPIASEHGVLTDKLFWITMGITVIAFSVISIIMAVFLFQYQHKEGQKAKYFPDNHFLELAWTIIPAA